MIERLVVALGEEKGGNGRDHLIGTGFPFAVVKV